MTSPSSNSFSVSGATTKRINCQKIENQEGTRRTSSSCRRRGSSREEEELRHRPKQHLYLRFHFNLFSRESMFVIHLDSFGITWTPDLDSLGFTSILNSADTTNIIIAYHRRMQHVLPFVTARQPMPATQPRLISPGTLYAGDEYFRVTSTPWR